MKEQETLKTLSVLALAALVFHLLTGKAWLAWLAALLLAAGMFKNPVGPAIARGWMKFADILGRFNTRVVLWLVFYLVLTPVAALYRLFNKAAVGHFRTDPGGSLFVPVEGDPCSKESFENPW